MLMDRWLFSPFGILECVCTQLSIFPFLCLPISLCTFHHVRRDRIVAQRCYFFVPPPPIRSYMQLGGRAFDTLAIRLLHHSPRSFSLVIFYICFLPFFSFSFSLSLSSSVLSRSLWQLPLLRSRFTTSPPPFTFFLFYFPSEKIRKRMNPPLCSNFQRRDYYAIRIYMKIQ